MLNPCACSENVWRAFDVVGLQMSSQFPAGSGRGRNGYRMPFWPALTLFYPHFLKKALANSSDTYPPPHSRCPDHVPSSDKVTLILSLSFLSSTPPFMTLTKEELFPPWIPVNSSLACPATNATLFVHLPWYHLLFLLCFFTLPLWTAEDKLHCLSFMFPAVIIIPLPLWTVGIKLQSS